MKSPKHIWIIEDEPGAQFVYEEILEIRYHLRMFSDTTQLLQALSAAESETQPPNLLIADIRLPGESFLNFLSSKEKRSHLKFPFLVVSSVDDLDALRTCFAHGAVDYLTKPFGKGELVVKVERFFTEQNLPKSSSNQLGIQIDPTALRVCRNAIWSPLLTSKEFQILTTLHQAKDCMISREAMVAHIWNDVRVTSKTFDVHLFNLRKKLVSVGVEIQFSPPNMYRLLCDGMNP
jgi:DNA-binding response OmpR family regulator